MDKSTELSSSPDREPNAELRRQLDDCEARIRAFTDLASHARHEINNPLAGLLGQAQLLLREDLSDKARRRVETIIELATRIRDAVAELRISPPT